MKVYRGLSEFQRLPNAVVTNGTFDGVHYGHRKILRRVQEIGRAIGGETVLTTFWPHPRMVLFPDENNLMLLSTIDEKIALMRDQGIDHMLIIEFTREFSNLTYEQFIKDILVDTIGTKKLVIGYDHKFGKKREGSFENLKEDAPIYGFDVEEIPPQEIDDVAISSTKIRKALMAGEVETAEEFLCTPYSITGTVVPGQQRGRTIGFPTANVHVPEPYKLIPGNGVYAVNVRHQGQMHQGMMNIGNRPTFNGENRSMEVHIFDFDRMIYNDSLYVEFKHQIRQEQRFDSPEALKSQLEQDLLKAKKLLR